jgi:hypothetical protein
MPTTTTALNGRYPTPTCRPIRTSSAQLTVTYVDDQGYTQFVVHGVPVDPGSICALD